MTQEEYAEIIRRLDKLDADIKALTVAQAMTAQALQDLTLTVMPDPLGDLGRDV